MNAVTKKMDLLYLRAVSGIRNFFDDLKNDESGMEVIQVIILLAVGIAVLAVVVTTVNNLLADSTQTINDNTADVFSGVTAEAAGRSK
ncbi:MAG: hypothetical protein IJ608_01080 [Lachnospiraceae bacterium]|nr:hypothetical protein [Lachnospiraceae bacterium]